MKLGIDFGTSNSAAAAIVDGQVVPVRFGQALQFRTTVYFPETMRDPDDFSLTPALEYEVERLIDSGRRDALAAGRTPNNDSLRRDAIRIVRRQWMEEQVREPRSSAALLQNAVYGDEALDAYFLEGEGSLVQSPKSMLGYNLHPRARQTMTGIATHVLEHIRLTASRQFDINIRHATLGRPVQFRSSIGEAGNAQALEILQTAAIAAGFDSVDFLEEPAAAAMHYHVSHDSRHDTVVVDIGGGTTDVAHASVGGSAAPQVHRAWGIARGGTDIDLALSLAAYMPLFGRGITRVPTHHYVEAAMVQDMTRQREFRLHKYQDVPAPSTGACKPCRTPAIPRVCIAAWRPARSRSASSTGTKTHWTSSSAGSAWTCRPARWLRPLLTISTNWKACWHRCAPRWPPHRRRCSSPAACRAPVISATP